MSSQPSTRAKEIYVDLLKVAPAQREAELTRLCAENAGLLAQVRELLKDPSSQGAETVLPSADRDVDETAGEAVAWQAKVTEQPGATIGPYRLLQRLGEGGFGSVFMAEQEHPVRRTVALKIIKLGMDTRQVVARFEQERQALALMDHPNIAKVFDAGATEQGRPYFVMELCRGEPITSYCDKNSLSITERLTLFVQVCQAVQHAHQKGLIHRDIKPSNVLVANLDGKPQVKVIDFGIAKATASKLTEKTLYTDHQQMIGTPQYMSPEQAEGSLDIDTRTDVYALGVLLYELLIGVTPFDEANLSAVPYTQVQRIIREIDPPRPSTRLSNNTRTAASVAAQRHTEPRKLGSTLRGELDWIVMKALEKDRQRRYETANGFAMDVNRYLAGEPVFAAPPSRVYRIQKFVRRNRGGVIAGSLVAGMLVLGLGGTAYGLRKALIARDGEAASKLAAQREAERAVAAEMQTKAKAEELKRVADFQSKMLNQIDSQLAGIRLTAELRQRFADTLERSTLSPADRAARVESFTRDLGRISATDVAIDLIDLTILKPAIETLDKEFKNQPLVDASLRRSLADLYVTMGRYDKALPLEQATLSIRRRELGPEHVETLNSVAALGQILRLQGKWNEAEPYLREAQAGRDKIMGADDSSSLLSKHEMAQLYMSQGKLSDAEVLFRETLDRSRAVLGPDHPDTLIYLASVGLHLQAIGKPAEAEPFLKEAMEKHRAVSGIDNPLTIKAVNNYAVLLLELGRLEEAEKLLHDSAERLRRVFGEDHPETLLALNNRASALDRLERPQEAEPIYREVLEKDRRSLGNDHPDTLRAISNLANNLRAQSKFDEAEPLAREAMEGYRRVQGTNQRETLIAINVYGYVQVAKGHPELAEPYWREAYELGKRVLGEDHPDVLIWTNNLGSLLRTLERPAESEPLLREVLEKSRRINGDDHPTTIFIMNSVALTLLEEKKLDEAAGLLSEVAERSKRLRGADDYDTLIATLQLANVLRDLGKLDLAEARMREVVDGFSRTSGPMSATAAAAKASLARVLMLSKKYLDAEKMLLESESVLKASIEYQARYPLVLGQLVELYTHWDQAVGGAAHAKAIEHWAETLRKAQAATQPTTVPASQPSR